MATEGPRNRQKREREIKKGRKETCIQERRRKIDGQSFIVLLQYGGRQANKF